MSRQPLLSLRYPTWETSHAILWQHLLSIWFRSVNPGAGEDTLLLLLFPDSNLDQTTNTPQYFSYY